ncbi:MAG: Na+/H+ antiporter subunit B [Verrucomicrobiota bacterium]
MKSVILKSAASFLFIPLLVLSLLVLWRGHNLPGGGFIGGLLAASSFVLMTLAEGVNATRIKLRAEPVSLIGTGLLIAIFAALLPLFAGDTFFTGLWLPSFELPVLGKIHLGTPLIFDIGVYVTVIGFAMAVVFQLEELE